MALFSRVYFNAVFGALGGLLGWMLFGVFGDKNQSDFGQRVLGGALIGGAIGYLVVSVDGFRDRSLIRFCRLACYGVILGAAGGVVGMLLGEQVNEFLVKRLGSDRGHATLGHRLATMGARGLGWMFLGLAIGMSEGIAARSLGKFSYSSIGGTLGGFVGGALFWLFYSRALDGNLKDPSTAVWGALGLVILGACIGSLSALVQAVFQPASVRVLRGWQEGREYPLEKAASSLGRDEHVDIALFRDMKVEKHHAFIHRIGERYVLVNNKAPADQTRVNDAPIGQSCELNDGDRIQLGNVVLRFQLRAALANRLKVKKPLPLPALGIRDPRSRS